jgi:pectate lyase
MLPSRTFTAVAAAVALLIAPATVAIAQLKAFPGAEGAGANATDGRGGDVYHVTKLTDYTGSPALSTRQGTLRHAISSADGPRTIVFDVGGTIQLLDELSVNRSNITIAGQTAPGPGITLRDYTFQVTSSSSTVVSDVIVRHIRSRKGDLTTSKDAAGVLGSGTTQNVILDHISASWGEDEVLSVTNNATNVTVQYSHISEGLNAEGHGFGSLVRPRVNSSVSFHHNLFANSQSRQARLGTYDDRLLQFDFRNNVVYNWGDRAGYAGGSGEPELEHVDP